MFDHMQLPTRENIALCVLLVMGLAALPWGCHPATNAPMSDGERLYRAKCASCHRLMDPEARCPEQWQALLVHHGPAMTEAERSAILTHLITQEKNHGTDVETTR